MNFCYDICASFQIILSPVQRKECSLFFAVCNCIINLPGAAVARGCAIVLHSALLDDHDPV